jgi:hypothetical protein
MSPRTIRKLIVVAPVAALLLLTNGVGTAGAHRAYAPDGHWAHMDTRYYHFLNDMGHFVLRAETRDAQLDWHNKVGLRFDSTSSHDVSRIHAIDNGGQGYGATGWYGLAEVCHHCWHLHTRLNPYYLQDGYWWQSTACEEIGHNVGENHHPYGDCMGRVNATVHDHTISDINGYYSQHGL